MDREEDAGPPPDTDAIAELLAERYPRWLKPSEKITVESSVDPTPGLAVVLDAGRDRYRIDIHFLRGAEDRDPWMLVADALDALFGTFLESQRAYRDLPTGDDVEFDGAFFRVDVERSVPELMREADRLLEHDGSVNLPKS